MNTQKYLGCLALSVVIGVAFGCAERQQDTRPVTADRESSHTVAGAEDVRARPSIDTAIAQWRSGEDERDAALDTILQIAERDQASARLRAFDLSEAEFISLPDDRRRQVEAEFTDRSRVLRLIARALIERGREAAEQGQPELARDHIRAAEQLGEANTGPEIVQLGKITGQAIMKAANEASEELPAPAVQ